MKANEAISEINSKSLCNNNSKVRLRIGDRVIVGRAINRRTGVDVNFAITPYDEYEIVYQEATILKAKNGREFGWRTYKVQYDDGKTGYEGRMFIIDKCQ